MTLKAYDDKPVVLSGGIPLDGVQWSEDGKGVRTALLPGLSECGELWEGHRRLLPARYE